MDLNEILVFATVVRTGSFTAAGAELGMPKSTVSRKISELEARLNARLLQRTTRKLSLTDVGHTFYEYCARIVSEVEEAERAVGNLEGAPRGLLRVTAPLSFGFVGPIVAEFLARYPEVQIELVCTDRVVDLVEERFDVGIRAGPLADSTLIAKSLGRARAILIASPAYLEQHGRPRSPEDLTAHACLLFGAGVDRTLFRLRDGSRTAEVAVAPRFAVNDTDMLFAAALAGVGIARMPVFRCMEELRTGRLERVLPTWTASETPMHVVVPSARHLSPKVKTFVDHMHARMTPPPWERETAA